MKLLSWAFGFIWDVSYNILNFEIDFGDISFTLWQFAVGGAVIYILIRLIRGIFNGSPD